MSARTAVCLRIHVHLFSALLAHLGFSFGHDSTKSNRNDGSITLAKAHLLFLDCCAYCLSYLVSELCGQLLDFSHLFSSSSSSLYVHISSIKAGRFLRLLLTHILHKPLYFHQSSRSFQILIYQITFEDSDFKMLLKRSSLAIFMYLASMAASSPLELTGPSYGDTFEERAV